MARARSSGVFELFQLAQIGLIFVLYWIALGLFVLFYPAASWINIQLYITVSLLLVLALIFTSFVTDEEKTNWLLPNLSTSLQASFKRTLAVLFTLLLYTFATKTDALSRFFLFATAPFLYVALFFTHNYLPRLMVRLSFRKRRSQTTLLCGTPDRVTRLHDWFARKSRLGLDVIGVLTPAGEPGSVDGIPVIGRPEDLDKVLAAHPVTQVILMHVPEPKAEIVRYYEACERHGTRLLVINDLDDILGHAIVLQEDDGLTFIGVRHEPLENVVNRAMKRLLDIVLSAAVVAFVLLPVALVVKVCQLFQSPGPLFYHQRRAGLKNQVFNLLKFRTMHLHAQPAEVQATQDDPRIYPAGRIFRRFSLDELPQFWNILRGDMSTVGPRPHLLEHNTLFAQVMGNYHVRSMVKPGLTGLAQLRGFRGQTTTENAIQARIASDLYYIENWSLALDLVIILRTVPVMVVPPKTAY